MEAFLWKAIKTEIRRNTAISTRMITTSFFSEVFFTFGRIRSMVSVELEVSTSEDSVDIDAESTSTTTSPMSRSGSAACKVAGIMASYSGLPLESVAMAAFPLSLPSSVQNSRSKPPSR